ncbi:uncharacterized protein LOC134828168 [Culicoides brevitarsis]|uniref:uncharacterized protein LOC134828168 n=1 Tax=Culicoides brevitarsis TaxID=469753 RepID=UPI00307C4986
MRVVALISGGKDSIYNAMLAQAEGHEIVALANLHPKDKDELDSYMYQTVGHQGIEKIAEAMELPLYRKETEGTSLQKGKSYEPTCNDEVEDLFDLLREIKDKENISGVACGAILSDYQRVRVENVCQRLQLISLTYLWRRDQAELLQEMIDCKIEAILIKVAALGLMPNHLGKSLSEMKSHLLAMHDKYTLNVCGEGGEYETFTLDCPLFKKRIIVEDMQMVLSSADPICPVGYINFTKLKLAPKTSPTKYKIKTSKDFVQIHNLDNEILDEIQKDLFPTTDAKESNCALLEKATTNISVGNSVFVQNKPQKILNKKGWLFISGIECSSTDPALAITEGLCELESMLVSENASLKDLVNIILYVKNMKDFAIINSSYIKIINFQNPPTRVCVECELPECCTIIVEATAHKPRDDFSRKTVLHVQGISHWAPANIGPYSQSMKIGNIIYISGQIALNPGSLEIIDGGIDVQCCLVLRHISRIIEAMNVNGKLRDVLQGICYVTNQNDIQIARRVWEAQSTNAIIDYVVVKRLPRNALVELQVWLHLGNDKFEYEETGCSIDNFTVSLKRRWNYESECSSGICTIGNYSTGQTSDMSEEQLLQVFDYFIRKMCPDVLHANNEIHTLYIRIFYHVSHTPLFLRDVLDKLHNERINIKLAITLVPVCGFQSNFDIISMTAIRHE